jgi:hypothetical protein
MRGARWIKAVVAGSRVAIAMTEPLVMREARAFATAVPVLTGA